MFQSLDIEFFEPDKKTQMGNDKLKKFVIIMLYWRMNIVKYLFLIEMLMILIVNLEMLKYYIMGTMCILCCYQYQSTVKTHHILVSNIIISIRIYLEKILMEEDYIW